MIQRDFSGLKSTAAVGFFEGRFGVGVQTLHDAVIELLLRMEPVQNQFPMRPQRSGYLLERFDATIGRVSELAPCEVGVVLRTMCKR